jgi:hypothetical protein
VSDQVNPQQKSNVEKLQELLQFDPAKRHPVSQQLLGDALKEITEEREKAAKAQAKEFLLRAVNLVQEWDKKRKEFQSMERKFEKELGKLMKQINALAAGQEAPDEEGEEKQG